MAGRRWARPQVTSRLARRGLLVVSLLVCAAATSAAQSPSPKPQVPSPSVEVAPFGGYRFGSSGAAGSPFMPVVYDAGGGVSFGVIVDVPYGPPQDGLKFEALFSHERSWIEVQRAQHVRSAGRRSTSPSTI